jgi:hypothetical protein
MNSQKPDMEFDEITSHLNSLVNEWEPILAGLSEKVINQRQNSQERTIKQILGHMIDSASNNIHRIVHLQYDNIPSSFPDYANLGNNDRWIKIQNYREEEWNLLIQHWKYSNLHLIHVINNVDPAALDNEWISALGMRVSLRSMIIDYLRHFKLHISEINELINKN